MNNSNKYLMPRVLYWVALIFFINSLWPTTTLADELFFIDAHSQVDHQLEDLDLIIKRMKQAGVRKTILSARSKRKPAEILEFASDYPEEIIPAVRTKSGAYRKNKPKFYKKIDNQLDTGQYKAMVEILLYHAQKGDKAPEVIVYPDDERVQYVLTKAIVNNWPFVIHIEFASLYGNKKKRFYNEMETLLSEHRQHPFVLNHMGQMGAAEINKLIKNHTNIYFMTSHANPVITSQSNQPWINMFDGKVLAKEWRELIIKYPDRFIFALDNVWERHWREFYVEQMEHWRNALMDLPEGVRHKVAHGNAERTGFAAADHAYGYAPFLISAKWERILLCLASSSIR